MPWPAVTASDLFSEFFYLEPSGLAMGGGMMKVKVILSVKNKYLKLSTCMCQEEYWILREDISGNWFKG